MSRVGWVIIGCAVRRDPGWLDISDGLGDGLAGVSRIVVNDRCCLGYR